MKRLFSLSLILLFLLNPVLGYCIDYTADANCLTAWLFTEGSGTTVDNAQGNSLADGTFVSDGHPAWAAMAGTGAPSYADYMVDFTPNDYISFLNWNMGAPSKLSFTMWINSDVTAVQSPFGDTTVSDIAGIEGFNNNGVFWTRMYLNSANRTIFGGTWNTATWYFFTTVYDGSTFTLYVDCVSTGTPISGLSGNVYDATAFYLGKRGSQGFYWNGKMSETAFFDRDLSSTEINDIMDNGLVGAAPPVAVFQPIINIF